MSELARFLVAAGVSSARFAQIAKFAYFRAASSQAKFRNARVNQSSVAAMTGLARSQVRTLMKRGGTPPNSSRDRIEKVVAGWTSDAEYITGNFSPRRLRVKGVEPSFSTLVKRYGGDVPPQALLKEMQRQRLVRSKEGYVQLTSLAQTTPELRALRHLSAALARVIKSAGIDGCSDSPIRAVTVEVRYPASSAAGRILMQRRLSKTLKAFAAEIEVAGEAVALESPASRHRKARISKVKVLLVTHDNDA